MLSYLSIGNQEENMHARLMKQTCPTLLVNYDTSRIHVQYDNQYHREQKNIQSLSVFYPSVWDANSCKNVLT